MPGSLAALERREAPISGKNRGAGLPDTHSDDRTPPGARFGAGRQTATLGRPASAASTFAAGYS